MKKNICIKCKKTCKKITDKNSFYYGLYYCKYCDTYYTENGQKI